MSSLLRYGFLKISRNFLIFLWILRTDRSLSSVNILAGKMTFALHYVMPMNYKMKEDQRLKESHLLSSYILLKYDKIDCVKSFELIWDHVVENILLYELLSFYCATRLFYTKKNFFWARAPRIIIVVILCHEQQVDKRRFIRFCHINKKSGI